MRKPKGLRCAARVVGHCYDALTTPERLALLERVEHETRRLCAPDHQLINELAAQATEEDLGGTLRCAWADRSRVTNAEGARRIAEAADLRSTAGVSGATNRVVRQGSGLHPPPSPRTWIWYESTRSDSRGAKLVARLVPDRGQ